MKLIHRVQSFYLFALLFAATCPFCQPGYAQTQFLNNFYCNAGATPFDARVEGLTEQTGDLILQCVGGNPTGAGLPIPAVDFTVAFNTNVTSRLMNAGNVTEALLLINEPGPGGLSVCPNTLTGCPMTGLGTGGSNIQTNLTYNPNGTPGRAAFNGYQGVRTSNSQLSFFGVPIDPPGPCQYFSGTFCLSGSLTLRLTNLRVNASGLGLGSGTTSNTITGFVSSSAPFSINNPAPAVGTIRKGLSLTASAGGNPPANASACTPPASQAAALVQTVNFTKGFGTAFKLRSLLGTSRGDAFAATTGNGNNTESDFIPLNYPALGNVGLADYATRVLLTVNNVPPGVTLYVPLTIGNNATTNITANSLETFQLVTGEAVAAGSFASAANLSFGGTAVTGYAQVNVTAGTGIVVYELTKQSLSPINAQGTITNFSIPVLANYNSFSGPGATTYQIDFAPTSTTAVVSATSIPRFVTASPQVAGFSLSACSTPAPLSFVPISPCRVLDTRNTPGTFGGPALPGGTSRDFPIPAGSCGIPTTALAYSLNTAVVPQDTLGYLTLWPTGKPQPETAILNSDGRVKSNAAIVAAGTSGSVSAFASNTTDLILDINGYFVPAATSASLVYYPLAPCRVADTRNAIAPLGGPPLPGGKSRTFPILSSSCGVPPTAQAYSINLAVVPRGTLGYLTAWPTGNPQPFTAALNAPTGAVTANAAIVRSGSYGGIDIFSSNATDLIIDIDGYFAPPGTGGLSFYALTPCRFLDTRFPISTPLTGTATQTVAGRCGSPATAQAFAVNATAVPTSGLGYLTLWSASATQPYVATLSASDGAVTGNLALVPGPSGSIGIFTSNSSQLIFDLFGYFAP